MEKIFDTSIDYKNMTIAEAICKIGSNEMYLPAIQRNFVWSANQIENLWDSVIRSYPISTFLFWNVEREQINKNEYIFYKFLLHYHERDGFRNEIAQWPEMKESVYGILDGQQRLSALYLSLQGSYASKLPRKRRDNPDAYPKKVMCFNCLYGFNSLEADTGNIAFKFISECEISDYNSNDSFWIPIKKVLEWDKVSKAISYRKELSEYTEDQINYSLDQLAELWNRIHSTKIINYCEISTSNLDNILDVFVRVNSGGTQLSKADLIFSTITSHWDIGRQEIEELTASINRIGYGFDFSNDFIVNCCLMLTGCPMALKISTFKEENITKIQNNWNDISESISKTVLLLSHYGFSAERLNSKNSIIPVIYYYYLKKQRNKTFSFKDEEKKEIQLFIILSHLAGTYSSSTNKKLSEFRKIIESMAEKQETFSINFIRESIENNDTITLDVDCEELVESKYSDRTFMLLALLYPSLQLDRHRFHQDHIHPKSLFSKTKLKQYVDFSNFSKEEFESKQVNWNNKKDNLPNLQLLLGDENFEKGRTLFKDWIETRVDNVERYKKDNYIPNIDLSLTSFDTFYNERRKLLLAKLKEIVEK